jgi:hypothetical protein
VFVPDVLSRLRRDVQAFEAHDSAALWALSAKLRRARSYRERQTLDVSVVDDDVDGVGATVLQYRQRREWNQNWNAERHVRRNAQRSTADVHLSLNLRQHGVPIGIDHADAEGVSRVGFAPVVRELRDENHPERCRELLAPKDRDAATEDKQLAV